MMIALVLPVLLGYLALKLLNGRAGGFAETIFLSYGAGLGLISLGTFYRGVFSVPFNTFTALVMFVFMAAVLLSLTRIFPYERGSLTARLRTEPIDWKQVVLISIILAWLCFRITFILYEGFQRPIVAQDSWWSRNGKFFFYYGFLLDTADEHFFGRGYRVILGYPLLTYMNQVWISEFLGFFHESLMKAWAPLYFISAAGLVFSTIKKEGGLLSGLLAVFFFSSAPLLVYHSVEAYSDIALGYYVLAGSLMLWQYMEGADRRTLALAGLFFAMGGFTKSDGIVHLFAGGTTLVAFNLIEKRYDWKGLAYFILPVVLYLLPWFIFKSYYGLGYGHGYGTGIGQADEAGAIMWSPTLHFEVWPVFFREIFLSVDHGLVFAFLAFISILGFRTIFRSNIKYLLLIITIVISSYLFVFTATYDYVYVLNRMATNRNLISVTPLAFIAAGLAALRMLRKES